MSELPPRAAGVTNTQLSQRQALEQLSESALELLRSVPLSEFVLITRQRETAQYDTERHSPPKQKGGHAPVDYDAAEAYADLEQELRRPEPDYSVIARNYFYLRALLRS